MHLSLQFSSWGIRDSLHTCMSFLRKIYLPGYNIDPQFIQILSVLGLEVVLCPRRALTICTWLLTWFSRTVLHIKHPQILPLRWALLMHCVTLLKGRTCEWNPTVVDDRSFVNTSNKFHLGIEHCPGRRRGKHAALKLIFPSDSCFVLPVPSKIRTPECDIHCG